MYTHTMHLSFVGAFLFSIRVRVGLMSGGDGLSVYSSSSGQLLECYKLRFRLWATQFPLAQLGLVLLLDLLLFSK
jgi:hypothetical protein